MKKENVLSISHNLFLTRQERYDWYNGKDLTVIGASCPVWFNADRPPGNQTSEPAIEVFCKYNLINRQENIYIRHTAEGYDVLVPKEPLTKATPPTDEIWKSMKPTEKENWYRKNEPTPSIHNLLDIKDGGSQWLAFRQYNKIKKGNRSLNLIHFFEIADWDEMLDSLL
jgi:hypothetical protein